MLLDLQSSILFWVSYRLWTFMSWKKWSGRDPWDTSRKHNRKMVWTSCPSCWTVYRRLMKLLSFSCWMKSILLHFALSQTIGQNRSTPFSTRFSWISLSSRGKCQLWGRISLRGRLRLWRMSGWFWRRSIARFCSGDVPHHACTHTWTAFQS